MRKDMKSGVTGRRPAVSALLASSTAVLGLTAGGGLEAATFGPIAYSAFGDSPFAGGTFAYFHLDNFETGGLGVPGVAASAGYVLGPGTLTDSVDGDDGLVDGMGAGGHSWYSGGSGTLTFTFDAVTLGRLPTAVGVVWTDVGAATPTLGYGAVSASVHGPGHTFLAQLGPYVLGDGSYAGQTPEDRFFGFGGLGPIAELTISMEGSSTDWEVDHLQYGAVPEPAPTLAALGLLGWAGFVARRRCARRCGLVD
jgi:hypothetical protein